MFNALQSECWILVCSVCVCLFVLVCVCGGRGDEARMLDGIKLKLIGPLNI